MSKKEREGMALKLQNLHDKGFELSESPWENEPLWALMNEIANLRLEVLRNFKAMPNSEANEHNA